MTTKHGRGKPFETGNQSGKGRPAGSRNKATVALQELLDGESEAIIRKVIELALTGDERALRLCIERLIPPCRERVVQLKLPPHITTPVGVAKAVSAILTAAAKGEITPGEAIQLANVLEVRRKTIETQEIDRRVTELEKRKQPPVESGLP